MTLRRAIVATVMALACLVIGYGAGLRNVFGAGTEYVSTGLQGVVADCYCVCEGD